MSRETKFGLLLVCVLTSVFGVLVYKRLHKPTDLVAGTDHDPAAIAVSDKYPAEKPAETPSPAQEPPAALIAAVEPLPTPAPVARPATPSATVDSFESQPVVSLTPVSRPKTVQKVPADLDDDFFSAPKSTAAKVATSSTPLPAQEEPDPFAADPVTTRSADPEPVRAAVVGQALPTQPSAPATEEAFDPFGGQPTTTVQSVPSTPMPVEIEAAPFGQEPPQAEPVTTSSRSATVAEPAAVEVRTFEPEPKPVVLEAPKPVFTKPAADPLEDDPFAPAPVAAKPTVPSVTLAVPETKTAAAQPVMLDPLDISPPVTRIEVPVARPVTPPQALPVDLDFAPTPRTPVVVSSTALNGSGYIVEPGDNFWAISKKLYGTGRYFQALAAHNAGTVADPSKMRPGLRIAAPSAAELESRYAAIPSPTANSEPTMTASSPARPIQTVGFFVSDAGLPMYRVGEQDTLSGIAYAHLGRASRWVQIYELNRQALKDGNTLKVGSELRLPADASQVQMTGGAAPRR